MFGLPARVAAERDIGRGGGEKGGEGKGAQKKGAQTETNEAVSEMMKAAGLKTPAG